MKAKKININSLKSSQIAEVILLHLDVLGYTMNSRLGFNHLKYVYMVTSEHKKSKVAVATFNEKIVGLIVLSLDPIDLKNVLLSNLGFGRLVKTIFKFIIRPSLLNQLFDSRKVEKPICYKENVIKPLLTVIAVKKKYQGLEIGTKLINYANKYFSSNDYFVYKVDTLLNNEISRSFYRNNGFIELEKRGNNIVLVKEI
jgi:ribosomal protein S18 acetylase RimI-like enzyme